MIAIPTESEKIMAEIMSFTGMIVKIADMNSIPVQIRAKAIFEAEGILHRVIMHKLEAKCVEKSIPSNN